MASLFRSAGLTFKDVGFIKFNMAFPPMVAVAHFGLTGFLSSTMSTTVLEKLPVPVEKVPFFVIAVMPIIAVMCAVVAIMALTVVAPNGYESQHSRKQKAPGAIAAAGMPAWIDRVQGAQYNTWEACICMLVSFYVGSGLNLPALLFAKIAAFVLLNRLAYPIVYALDIDLLRAYAGLDISPSG